MEHEEAHQWARTLRTVHGQLCADPWPVLSTALGAPLLPKTEFIDENFQSQAQVTQSITSLAAFWTKRSSVTRKARHSASAGSC